MCGGFKPGGWIIFISRIIVYTTLYTSFGFMVAIAGVGFYVTGTTIYGNRGDEGFPLIFSMLGVLLCVLSYILLSCTWPSKKVLIGIKETKYKYFFPWIISALLHSLTICMIIMKTKYKYKSNALAWIVPEIILMSIPQFIVWAACFETYRKGKRMRSEPQELQTVTTNDNYTQVTTSDDVAVDVPPTSVAEEVDLPPSYNEATFWESAGEKRTVQEDDNIFEELPSYSSILEKN